MKELMQKALNTLVHQKSERQQAATRSKPRKEAGSRQGEDWDMSPEDALRVGTVARYK